MNKVKEDDMRIKELEAENFELKERNHRLEKAVVNTTKRIKELEGRLESLWNKTGGIEPDCGQMWLTPRMEDDAELMAKVMKLHDRIKELEEKNERHHRIAEKFIELNRKSKVQLAKVEEVEISHLEVMKDVYYLIDSGNNIQAQEVILKTLNNFKKKKRRE